MRDSHLHPAISLRGLTSFLLALPAPLIASIGGAALTAKGLAGWYPTLRKPFFTPPDWAFPLVWTFLYALMVLCFWRILRARAEAGPKGRAITWFLVQMALNLGWSWAFFYLRSPLLGLAVVGALAVSIAMTIRAFMRIDRPAGLALLPYLAWVIFAGVLNGAIVVLNPG